MSAGPCGADPPRQALDGSVADSRLELQLRYLNCEEGCLLRKTYEGAAANIDDIRGVAVDPQRSLQRQRLGGMRCQADVRPVDQIASVLGRHPSTCILSIRVFVPQDDSPEDQVCTRSDGQPERCLFTEVLQVDPRGIAADERHSSSHGK